VLELADRAGLLRGAGGHADSKRTPMRPARIVLLQVVETHRHVAERIERVTGQDAGLAAGLPETQESRSELAFLARLLSESEAADVELAFADRRGGATVRVIRIVGG